MLDPSSSSADSSSSPPSSSSSSPSALAVFKRNKDLQGQYQAHRRAIQALQRKSIQELPDELAEHDYPGQDLTAQEIKERTVAFLSDRATVFRCLRRSGFDSSSAFALLHTTLRWRLRTDIDSLSLDSLHPLYVAPPRKLKRPPLLWLNAGFLDNLRRPVALITLRSLQRTEEGGLEDVKEYIVASLEVVRRRIAELRVTADEDSGLQQQHQLSTEKSTSFPQPLQCSFIFDLSGSTSTNFELELLPFLLDILRNHYPSLVSSVHVLNFGWLHSGIWTLAKRLLPRKALEKVYFVVKSDLVQEGGLFDKGKLPKELGGEWDVNIEAATDDVMSRLARPRVARVGLAGATGRKRSQSLRSEGGGGSAPASPTTEMPPNLHLYSHVSRQSAGISRAGSFDSLADNYFSTYATPRGGNSRGVTPGASGRATPAEEALPPAHQQQPAVSASQIPAGANSNVSGWGSATGALRMTVDAANKLRKLQMTRGGVALVGNGGSTDFREPADPSASGEGATSNSGTVKRIRSLRDFRLWDEGQAVDERGNARQSFFFPSEEEADEDSDASGKAGESNTVTRGGAIEQGDKANGAAPQPSSPTLRFFKRWTGGSQTHVEERVPEQSDGSSPLCAAPAPASVVRHSVHHHRRLLDVTDPPRFLSRRTRKPDKVPGTVSPYNSANPFWGYPAYLVPPSNGSEALSFTRITADRHSGRMRNGSDGDEDDRKFYEEEDAGSGSITPTGRPRATSRPDISPRHTRLTRNRTNPQRIASYAISGLPARQRQMAVRRRWRDLVRTLVYLFALRILSLNRQIQNKVAGAFEGVWQVLIAVTGLLRREQNRTRGGEGGAAMATSNEEGPEEVEWRQRTERHRKLRAAGVGVGATAIGRPRTNINRTNREALSLHTRSSSSSLSSPFNFRKREMVWMMIIFALTAIVAGRRGGGRPRRAVQAFSRR